MKNTLARCRRKNAENNMIPLINIVFLLLIFFMIAGRIEASRPPELDLPVSYHAAPATAQAVTISINAAGQWFVQDQPITADTLPMALDSMALSAQTGIDLFLHQSLKARDLDAMLEALRTQGIARVRLVTREGERL